MKKELIGLYKNFLFTLPQTTPTLKTYAIVDSARDETLTEKVMLSGLGYVDLWHEEMFELEQERPLYLVELQKENNLTDYILSEHSNSVATYFISPYSLETLQAYYSTFTYVQIEEEQGVYEEAIFGYYDPNILPNYTQTLYTKEKVNEFFAGVAMWLVPSVENENELYIAFRDKEEQVDDVNLQLKHFIKEKSPMLNFDNVRFPTQASLEVYGHEVKIDHTQMQMFDKIQKEKFVKASLQMFHEEGYSHITAIRTYIDKGLELLYQAMQEGVSADTALQRYMLLGLLLEKPLHAYRFYNDIIHAESQEEKREVLEQLLWKLEKQRRTDGNKQ